MTLLELARQIPDDPRHWSDWTHLPDSPLTWAFRRQMSGLFSGQDHMRIRAAQRLGIGLRPYEAGDRLRDLSWPVFARTDEMWTRVEPQPGRGKATLILHLNPGMEYRGPGETVSKGQVCLALASLLASAHRAELHQVQSFSYEGEDLLEYLQSQESRLRKSQWVWIFTDLFPQSGESAEAELTSILSHLKDRPKMRCLVLRDPSERADFDRQDQLPGSLLSPFVSTARNIELKAAPGSQLRQMHLDESLWSRIESNELQLKNSGAEVHIVDVRTDLNAFLEQMASACQLNFNN